MKTLLIALGFILIAVLGTLTSMGVNWSVRHRLSRNEEIKSAIFVIAMMWASYICGLIINSK